MMKNSSHLNYGLEAGSKAELLLAMGYNNQNSPITVNGFKDEEMITLGFIASYQGYKITIIIEGLNHGINGSFENGFRTHSGQQ